nr:probable WRKY transcription factor 41 [Tanacetum cinerariifolium]
MIYPTSSNETEELSTHNIPNSDDEAVSRYAGTLSRLEYPRQGHIVMILTSRIPIKKMPRGRSHIVMVLTSRIPIKKMPPGRTAGLFDANVITGLQAFQSHGYDSFFRQIVSVATEDESSSDNPSERKRQTGFGWQPGRGSETSGF